MVRQRHRVRLASFEPRMPDVMLRSEKSIGAVMRSSAIGAVAGRIPALDAIAISCPSANVRQQLCEDTIVVALHRHRIAAFEDEIDASRIHGFLFALNRTNIGRATSALPAEDRGVSPAVVSLHGGRLILMCFI